MSSSSFLQKTRKAQLEELAAEFGLNTEGMKKAQVEILMDDYLTNHPELAADERVAAFYKRRSPSELSPIKKESVPLGETDKIVRVVKRRTTKAAEELANSLQSSSSPEPVTTRARAALARTPSKVASLAQSLPPPASPSVIADVLEQQSAVIRTAICDFTASAGVVEAAQSTRETLSSVVSVEALILLFEAFNLRKEVLGDRYAFTIPAIPVLHTAPHPVDLPDLFLLLTTSFWAPFLLWTATSLLLPLAFAYFFNLTARPRHANGRAGAQKFEYRFDPLTFNIIKAVLAYAVYAREVTGGLVGLDSIERVRAASAGGWEGIVTGCGIGILVTFYEAIIRK